LPFEAGVKNHFHAAGRESFDRNGACFPDFGKDSFFELAEDRVLEGVLGGNLIHLFDAVAGVGERLRELAVIAQDEESFGIQIKASHVCEMMKSRRKEFVDGGAVVLIVAGADQAGGFVHDDGLNFERFDAFAASFDEVTGLDPVTGIKADLTIDDDFAIKDEGIATTAGAYACGGEVFIEADAFGCW
jgi:hypothetical protein